MLIFPCGKALNVNKTCQIKVFQTERIHFRCQVNLPINRSVFWSIRFSSELAKYMTSESLTVTGRKLLNAYFKKSGNFEKKIIEQFSAKRSSYKAAFNILELIMEHLFVTYWNNCTNSHNRCACAYRTAISFQCFWPAVVLSPYSKRTS